MSDDRHQQDADGSLLGMVYEMVEGIVEAHQHGEGIVAWHGQKGTDDADRQPLFF